MVGRGGIWCVCGKGLCLSDKCWEWLQGWYGRGGECKSSSHHFGILAIVLAGKCHVFINFPLDTLINLYVIEIYLNVMVITVEMMEIVKVLYLYFQPL